jgi:hypothetical protein
MGLRGPTPTPLLDRFLEKVQKTENCWNWTASTTSAGYGKIGEGGHCGRILDAHRVAYELFVGAIPEGKCALHHCDNKLCVNPSHLFLGTQKDNVDDSVTKGRHPCGEEAGRAKLTSEQVREIRECYRPNCAELGRRYGVTEVAVWNVVHGHTWKLG